MLRTSPAFALLLVFAAVASAQRRPFRNYTVADGLPNEVVRCVAQDARGFLWFGTEGGAGRFDGVEFATFDTDEGLVGDWVNQIVLDRSGDLWLAGGGAGLSSFDGARFRSLRGAGAPSGAICLLVDHEGRIWAGASELLRQDESGFVEVPTIEKPAGTIFALFEDAQHRIWIGTDQGYGVYAPRAAGYECVATGGPYWVSSFAQDASGTIWMGSDDGLKRFKADLQHAADLPPQMAELAGRWVRTLSLDREGALWIGTNGFGVVRHAPGEEMLRFTVANGLVGNNVLGITEDHEGNHWFATTTGVSKLTALGVETWSLPEGLIHNSVMCMVEADPGEFWVGTVQGVSHLVDGSFVPDASGYGLGDTFTLFALRDRRGVIWMGSELGASRLVDGRFANFDADDGWWTSPERWNRGRSIWEDQRGWIWFANDRGLSVFKDGRFHELEWPDRPDDLGCALLVDRTGSVWIGFHSGSGLFRFEVEDRGTGRAPALQLRRHFAAPGDIADGRICSRELDHNGNVWFGTRGAGALRFVLDDAGELQRVDRFSTANGLADDYVRCIMEDSRATLWIGTSNGVNSMPAQPEGRTMFQHLGIEDGLPGSIVQFCYEDQAGAIWFCTSNGITRYRAAEDAHPLVSPRVFISDFQVLGEADSSSLQLRRAELPYRRNSVAFEFVGITYRSERRPRFRYMLDGLDRDWSPPTQSRRVNYPHLPPGRYEFKVVAQNSDGLWSETPAAFQLAIAAPWWRSWWFLSLVLVAFVAAFYLLHRVRIERALAVERLRGRIAADLHDDLGSTLSSISILSEIALETVAVESPAGSELLGRIRRDARRMMEAMDDIVWAIRPQADHFETIVGRMRQHGCEMLEPTGASFELVVRGDSLAELRLPMETRRDLFLIFKEAITNVARHAACHAARAEIALEGRRLRLVVEDDGRGIGQPSGGGDGLRNMRSRATAAGATLEILSRPDEGTRIVLELPLARRG